MTLPYIVEAQIAFALLWLVYRLTMHRGGRLALNRAYLLGMTALALLIPALTLRVWPAPEMVEMPAFRIGDLPTIAPQPAPAALDIRWVYLSGVIVLLVVSAVQLLRLVRIIRTAHKRIDVNGCTCLQTGRIGRAATFLNYILINPASLDDSQLRQVFAHERAHVALGHSYDLLFAQAVAIALWWNPFVWLWKRSLREVHEYQADASVLAGGFDAGNYASLILQSLTGIRPGFASGFSYQLLKNRLVMIKNSRRGSAARILFALPVVAGLMATFSCAAKHPKSSAEPVRVITYAPQTPTLPETTPVATPAERVVHKIDVKVVGSDTTVSVNGNIVSDERATTKELIAQAHTDIRDGEAVSFTVETEKSRLKGEAVRIDIDKMDDGEQPLFFIDGVEAPYSVLKAIDPSKIQSIDVLKEAASIAKYGERGRNGVVLLTLKKPSHDPDEPFLKVEQMPTFQGGDLNAFRVWVQQQLIYPAAAAQANEQGRVIVQFVVERDGSLSNITVVRNPSQVLTDEALRVVRMSPKWAPGKQEGKAVRVKYVLPIEFSIAR